MKIETVGVALTLIESVRTQAAKYVSSPQTSSADRPGRVEVERPIASLVWVLSSQ
jgi:hypothetical protein